MTNQISTKSAMSLEAAQEQPDKGVARPWYMQGGYSNNIAQARCMVVLPLLSLFTILTGTELCIFGAAWVGHMLAAKYVYGFHTEMCIFNVPTYLSFAGAVALKRRDPLLLAAGSVLGVLKITICMSCCLHRYASHTAFKCGQGMKYFICILACFANQGGPIWWAAHHRCHHKFCDLPRDPHSPAQVGFENAFAFHMSNKKMEVINEEFVPKHLDEPAIRLLDNFAWWPHTMELILSYYFFGVPGLCLAYISGFVSMVGTLAFNCIFHPVEEADVKVCKATDFMSWLTLKGILYFPAFFIFAATAPLFTPFVGETLHETHHEFPQLAKRDSKDMGWYLFVYPLMKLGLIWDVHLPKAKKTL